MELYHNIFKKVKKIINAIRSKTNSKEKNQEKRDKSGKNIHSHNFSFELGEGMMGCCLRTLTWEGESGCVLPARTPGQQVK